MNDKTAIRARPLTDTLLRQKSGETRWAALTAEERNDVGGYAMRMYIKAAEEGVDANHYLQGQVTVGEAIRRQRRWRKRKKKPGFARGW